MPSGHSPKTHHVLLAEYLRLTSRRRSDAAAPSPFLPGRRLAELWRYGDSRRIFACRLRRPIPFKPNRYARCGTDFHTWVEHHLSGDLGSLVDLEDIMDARDDIAEPVSLTRLEDTFAASSWAERTTSMVEAPVRRLPRKRRH
ncbi:MAG: hypothetical protein U1U88_002032 [Lawsonella clevelandensis]